MSFVLITVQDHGKNVKAYVLVEEILAVIFIDSEKSIQIQFKNRPFNDLLFYEFSAQDLYNTAKLQISTALEKF